MAGPIELDLPAASASAGATPRASTACPCHAGSLKRGLFRAVWRVAASDCGAVSAVACCLVTWHRIAQPIVLFHPLPRPLTPSHHAQNQRPVPLTRRASCKPPERAALPVRSGWGTVAGGLAARRRECVLSMKRGSSEKSQQPQRRWASRRGAWMQASAGPGAAVECPGIAFPHLFSRSSLLLAR